MLEKASCDERVGAAEGQRGGVVVGKFVSRISRLRLVQSTLR